MQADIVAVTFRSFCYSNYFDLCVKFFWTVFAISLLIIQRLLLSYEAKCYMFKVSKLYKANQRHMQQETSL